MNDRAPGALTVPGAQPFPLWDRVPDRMRSRVLDIQWSRQRLWDLPLELEYTPTVSPLGLLHLPWWSHDGRPFRVAPLAVRADPRRYSEHYQRALDSDLAYPIHLLAGAARETTILDGVHRLLKAHMRAVAWTPVYHVTAEHLPLIADYQPQPGG